MVLDVVNVSLAWLKDQKIEDEDVSMRMMKSITDKEYLVPVVLRRGAVDIKIGSVYRVRRGREEIFGDLTLDLVGSLELEVIRAENDKVVGANPKKWVYVKE